MADRRYETEGDPAGRPVQRGRGDPSVDVPERLDEALAGLRRVALALDRVEPVDAARGGPLMEAARAHLADAARLLHRVALGELDEEPGRRGAGGPGAPCRLHKRHEGDAVVIDVTGDCGLASVPALVRLARQATAGAAVVVVDFTGATTLDHVATAALHRVQREAKEHGGRLAVCGGPAELLDELRRGNLQPFPDVGSALGGRDPGPRLVAVWQLSPDAADLVSARARIRRTCLDWRVPVGVANSVVDVASELLSNAFQHGKPPVTLTLQLTTRTVRVEVGDGSTAPAQQRPYRTGVSESGLGLQLVEHLSTSWGQVVAPDGKRVWALLTLTEPVPWLAPS